AQTRVVAFWFELVPAACRGKWHGSIPPGGFSMSFLRSLRSCLSNGKLRPIARPNKRKRVTSALEELERREMPAIFTPGTLVVERLGDGSVALTSAAAAVFLDQFNTSGTGQTGTQIVAVPTANGGSNNSLVDSGSATSDGLLLRSVDARYLS